MKKYCAFGLNQLDHTGIFIEESDNYFNVNPDNYGIYKLAIPKITKYLKENINDLEIEANS